MEEHELVSRLVRLETAMDIRFTENEKALNLAREAIKSHFNDVNNFQSRIEKLESSFATKGDLDIIKTAFELKHTHLKETIDKENETLKKLVYTGVGVAIVLSAIGPILLNEALR